MPAVPPEFIVEVDDKRHMAVRVSSPLLMEIWGKDKSQQYLRNIVELGLCRPYKRRWLLIGNAPTEDKSPLHFLGYGRMRPIVDKEMRAAADRIVARDKRKSR